jgi:tRNA(Ile)-lysidine synthase
MFKSFSDFILKEWDQKSPLLLGLSGGPDSLALYYLLLENNIPFSVAHVNHGWREESEAEAATLSQLCARDSIPFFEETLAPFDNKNMEEKGREARLLFFKKLAGNYQALVLGHHADDLAETVLKRVFEGASVQHLKGISKISHREGLTIWRPLLEVRKKEILEWLETRGICAFQDPTNADPRFLRGRLRQSIFPFLSAHFGKEVTSSLSRLAKASEELQEFLEIYLAPYRNLTDFQEDVTVLDLSGAVIKTEFEWKSILRDFFERQKVVVSLPVLEMVIAHLKKESLYKQMIIKDKRVVVQKKRVSVFKK